MQEPVSVGFHGGPTVRLSLVYLALNKNNTLSGPSHRHPSTPMGKSTYFFSNRPSISRWMWSDSIGKLRLERMNQLCFQRADNRSGSWEFCVFVTRLCRFVGNEQGGQLESLGCFNLGAGLDGVSRIVQYTAEDLKANHMTSSPRYARRFHVSSRGGEHRWGR